MKLKLLFIVMDLLTLLAIPLVYVYSKIHQFSRSIVNYHNRTAALRRLLAV